MNMPKEDVLSVIEVMLLKWKTGEKPCTARDLAYQIAAQLELSKLPYKVEEYNKEQP